MKNVLAIIFLVLLSDLSAQEKYTISGRIKDKQNGEDLIGATMTVLEKTGVGAITNLYGFYSLTLEAGEYTLSFQYIGFKTINKKVTVSQNLTFDIEMEEDTEVLGEVVITSEREDRNVSSNEMSVTRIDVNQAKEIAVFAGEPDVLKVAQMNPGIKPAGEGNAGFYVRGGGLDQNLILMDEAIVYNPSHILGLFSVFNGDALKNVTTYKGGMLPEYGGRTSSVMDIRMKDGNSKKFSATGGIGLITSKLTLEAPLVEDKGSFILSGRRTYIDLLLGLSNAESVADSRLNFYDFNAKANCKIGEKDRLYLSGYFGRDNFGFDSSFGLEWGNATGTLRWNHLFSDQLFSNTSFIISDYD